MSEYHGEEAREKAKEWGYPGDNIDAVNYATEGRCRWAWTDTEGRCCKCGDWNFNLLEDEDD